jgi:hypothetical protein
MLSTAFALFASLLLALITLGATYVAYHAAKSAVDAHDKLERELRASRTLREDVLALEGRMNRLAGRVYAQVRRPREPVTVDAEPLGNGHYGVNFGEIDPDLAAELALQNAAPVAPGKR